MRKLKTSRLPVEECAKCGTQEPTGFETVDFFSEGEAEQGDKHMEFLECDECGAVGCIQFTPPTNMFKLKGDLFGESEDVDDLYETARSLS